MKKTILLLLLVTFWSCVDNEEVLIPKYPTVNEIMKGPVAAGSELTITGQDLDDKPTILFNGEGVTPILIENSLIKLVIPEDAISGKLEIKFEQEVYNREFYLKILDEGWNSTQASTYYQIEFVTPLIGYAKKRDGTFDYIDKTIDGGNTWSNVLKELVPNSLLAVASENVVYMRTTSNRIKKTIDGGETWNEMQPFEIGYLIDKLFFKNELEGFLLAEKLGKSYVYKTNDGGLTWNEKKQIDISATFLELIHFKNDNIKLLNEKTNIIIRTENGGDTWEEEDLGIQPTYKPIFQFISDDNVWMSMISRINWPGGVFNKVSYGDWEEVKLPELSSYEEIVSIMFVDEQKGYLLTEKGGSLYTKDGGETWGLFYLDVDSISSATYYNNRLYIVAEGNFLTKTIN